MKLLSIFTVAATFVVGSLAAGPRPHHHHAALTVRGGAKLGPLDAKLAVDLSKAAATAYAAGSASKYINKQVGGKDTELAKLVTGDLFQLHAVITAVACGMFGLLNTGFADIKVIAVASLLALGLKFQDSGLTADTVKDNAVQGLIAIVLTILAFVD